MKTYEITIQAIITKTIRVEAENEDDAYCEAHERFDTKCDGQLEDYEQETLNLVEVTT